MTEKEMKKYKPYEVNETGYNIVIGIILGAMLMPIALIILIKLLSLIP